MAIVWVLTLWLVINAFNRFLQGGIELDAHIMIITSAIGIVCNIIMGLTLHSSMPHHHDHHGHGHSHNESHNHSHCESLEVSLNLRDSPRDDVRILNPEESPETQRDSHKHGGSHHQHHHHDHTHHHHGHSHDNMNVKAAFLHVLGDLVMSISVMLLSILLYFLP